MSPISAPTPATPAAVDPAPAPPVVDVWAWLEADPVLAARVDRYVLNNKLVDRATAIAHILRIYLKL